MTRTARSCSNIHAVANHAKVSTATVSRVLNQIGTVDPELAERVRKAVRELRYMPNTQARALVSGRSRLIGLILSDVTNPFFPQLIQSFEDGAIRREYEIIIGSTNYSPERMTQCVRRMLERKVEGVAVMTFGIEQSLLDELCQRGIPVASVGSPGALDAVISLEVDYANGLSEAVQHLFGLGHRQIAFISGPGAIASARRRRDAFAEALARTGLKANTLNILEGDHTMEGGFTASEKLLSRKRPPTAIVCSNDMTAIGVLHSAFGRGLRIPDDLSVIGFDDIHMAQFTVPPLSSIRMASTDLAEAALSALIGDGSPARRQEEPTVIPTRLIVRQTTGRAPLPERMRISLR
jgi:LacI family transcriptional regulator